MSGRARFVRCSAISAAPGRAGAVPIWRGGVARRAEGRFCSEDDASTAELATCQRLDVSLVAPGEAGYPPRLATLDDAPPLQPDALGASRRQVIPPIKGWICASPFASSLQLKEKSCPLSK